MTDSNLTILCPGQGAQHVGMGKAWADRFAVARETFEQANELLGFDLAALCFEGPDDRLNRTDFAQAAIYTTSIACCRALQLLPGATAGLSLGEFTALHLAGAFSFEDGLKLVRLRGQAMQEAAEQAGPSTMLALTGDASEEKINELCQRTLADLPQEFLVPANFNSPMQVVVSGSVKACELAAKLADEAGLKPTPLSVAGAFHSRIMQPAADKLAATLDGVNWSVPRCTVLSNVTGLPHEMNVSSIKQRLVEQLTSPVRWSQSMQWAAANLPGRYVEPAPGKVLTGLMRRINRSVKVENHAEPGEK
ncbi:MAG: ACP S-malonyltransferase [Phycisphaeraceae bacterium]|nr:ACP S-malonyltransferase [Phycisphaeraceae bacterium]